MPAPLSTPVSVRLWLDGSCDRRSGRGGWGAVLCHVDGSWERFHGPSEAPDSVSAEVMALVQALRRLPEDIAIELRTDCRVLVEALQGQREVATLPCGELLRAGLAQRQAPVVARWQRRNSTIPLRAAHHLANAARLFELLPAPA